MKPRRTRIRHKITLAVLIAIAVSTLIAAQLQNWYQERVALQQHEESVTLLTNSIAEGIEAIMMTGSTKAALSFVNHFKQIPYITDFKIVRFDGLEAFTDNHTIDRVNMALEEERYPRREEAKQTPIRDPADERLVKALETNEIVSFFETTPAGERALTLLAPIKTERDCRDCHASSRTRGVIQITTSLGAIEAAVSESRRQSLLVLVLTLLATVVIADLLLRRAVTGPLERLMGGMRKVSSGDLEHRVKVDRRDELGEMAQIFNEMTGEIRLTQAGLRREQDKLTTIILGANEGIVITDGGGAVVLVNPAAEALLGKSVAEITEAGFLELFDAPEEMQKWLAQKSSKETIIKVFNSRLFQVYVSEIQDVKGVPIGSAALIRDVTEEKRLEEELRRLSTTDGLTALANRRHLDQVLSDEFARAGRTKAPLSVIMFDVDHFKKFNDTHGHDQGDRVLQAVARCFRECLRKYDTACRYGGEEFLAILPSTDLEGAVSVAERIRREVEEMVVDDLKVTISLGVASCPDRLITAPEMLVETADAALYRAKAAGRNRVVQAEPRQPDGAAPEAG